MEIDKPQVAGQKLVSRIVFAFATDAFPSCSVSARRLGCTTSLALLCGYPLLGLLLPKLS